MDMRSAYLHQKMISRFKDQFICGLKKACYSHRFVLYIFSLKKIKKITGYCISQLFYIQNTLKIINEPVALCLQKNDCTTVSRVPDKDW